MIGITERGDAAINLGWKNWAYAGHPAILITKNPGLLLNNITADLNIIVHCTITGYGGSILEPNVPEPFQAIKDYDKIINKIGAERVVLRVDPIVVTPKGIDRAVYIIATAIYTRVRISFLDMYNHVKERFTKHGIPFPYTTLHAPLEQRNAALIKLQEKAHCTIEVCGEPGMKCSGCVSNMDCTILGITPRDTQKGQRPACACLALKKELLTDRTQCKHQCLYCYWKG